MASNHVFGKLCLSCGRKTKARKPFGQFRTLGIPRRAAVHCGNASVPSTSCILRRASDYVPGRQGTYDLLERVCCCRCALDMAASTLAVMPKIAREHPQYQACHQPAAGTRSSPALSLAHDRVTPGIPVHTHPPHPPSGAHRVRAEKEVHDGQSCGRRRNTHILLTLAQTGRADKARQQRPVSRVEDQVGAPPRF